METLLTPPTEPRRSAIEDNQNGTLNMIDPIAQFVKTVRGRNIRETIAALFLIGLFGAQLLLGDHSTLGVVGRVVTMIAAIVIGFVTWVFLHIPMSELQVYPPDQSFEHWRRRLTTQARGLQLAWLWYVLPLFAGIVLIYLGRTDSRLPQTFA